MKFKDEAKIIVSSGNGGHGAVTFRREKFIPRGGPSGGNGGRGGNVYFQASDDVNTLSHFRGKKFYRAKNGENGGNWHCDGKAGEDLIIKVPIGTLVKDLNSGVVYKDLSEEDELFLFSEGGTGGFGNMHFKSSTNQTPRYATDGRPGEEFELLLELKLLADAGLVGTPNAGKSTLLSTITAAKPKVADYPFTTLEPHLGVVTFHEKSLVMADIPGLIENAHVGKGLGLKFLKHIERTKVLLHLVDISWCIEPYEALESYTTIRNELSEYNCDLLNKPEIVCLTKIDALTEDEVQPYIELFENHLQKKVLTISSVSGKNIDQMKSILFSALDHTKKDFKNNEQILQETIA